MSVAVHKQPATGSAVRQLEWPGPSLDLSLSPSALSPTALSPTLSPSLSPISPTKVKHLSPLSLFLANLKSPNQSGKKVCLFGP